MLKYFLSLCALLMASALMLPSAAFAQSPNQDLLNALKYREKRIGSTRPAPIPAAPVSSKRVAEEAKGGRSAADAGPNDPGLIQVG